jgi:phosphoribosylanthranilate isomerase
VLPDVKFCGITRAEDALAGLDAGADYLGLVLAPSPRRVSVRQAASIVTSVGGGRVKWVGVFTDADLGMIGPAVGTIGLDVVQLHVPVSAAFARDVTRETGARVWCVGRVENGQVLEIDEDAGAAVEALLFDASKDGKSGGQGVRFNWNGARPAIDRWRGRVRIAVAGGLTPENVAQAVRVLSPDIVDVSSGVEQAPGIKDHQRMREFVVAAHKEGQA